MLLLTAGDDSEANGRTTSTRVYTEIKRAIIALDLMPGAVIQEEALARHLGVSRTPVREAFRRLEQEGLVKTLPKKGVVVSDVSIDDVLDVFDVRMCLEPFAARLATCRMPKEEIDRLRQLHTPPGGPHRGFHKGYRELHSSIARFCGNARMRRVLEALMDETTRILALGGLEERVRQHQLHLEILDAFERRDPLAAERAMQEHLLDFRRSFLSLRMNQVPEAVTERSPQLAAWASRDSGNGMSERPQPKD